MKISSVFSGPMPFRPIKLTLELESQEDLDTLRDVLDGYGSHAAIVLSADLSLSADLAHGSASATSRNRLRDMVERLLPPRREK